jgi:hypothetical protein
MCSGRVSSSYSTSDTRRVNLVTNPVISREWGKDREVFVTSGTYPWSCVTQIFHNGQPSHGGDRNIFEVMTSTLPKGTLGSVASLLAATLYRGHHNTNHIALVINYEPNVYLISKKEIKLKNRNLYKMCIIEAQLPVFINFFTNSETSSNIIQF